MTTIISSQRYLDNSIINDKMAELANTESVTLVAWDVKAYDCAILSDGHHTYAAAKELGITINFAIVDHPEGISGDDLLEQAWMDSDWYNVETEALFF
jgi:hypothetical protein